MNIGVIRDDGPPDRRELENGTVILTVPVSSAHAISLGVWLRRGSQDEPAGLGGLAHFLEHIVFKGTAERSALDLAVTFDALGAAVDAFTTKDYVAFTLRVLPEYMPPALDALTDMILRPALAPEMIALEQDVVCEEIQEARETPEDLLHDAFVSQLYGNHPRSRPILGSPETVRSFDQDVLRREHRSLFRGGNLVVAAAGNLDAESTDRLASLYAVAGGPEAAAAPLPDRSDAPFTAASEVIADATMADGRLEIASSIQQCYFEIGNTAVPFEHPDRIALAVLSSVLGGGMASRIFQAVREREGLAYSIYTYTDHGRDVGLFSCAGSCSPGKMARLEDVVRGEYRRLLTDGIDEGELESNRAQIKSHLVFSIEGSVNRMGRIAKDEIVYGRQRTVAELINRVDNVSTDDLMRCAALYADPDRWTVAIHGPER